MSLSQAASDGLCDLITESHYVRVGDVHYTTTIKTRGIRTAPCRACTPF